MEFKNPKEYIGELIGSMLLVGFGCFAGGIGGGALFVAITFSLGFIGLIYCFGGICNCHFNPLISLSMFINGRMDANDTVIHILAQIIGGIILDGGVDRYDASVRTQLSVVRQSLSSSFMGGAE